MAFFGALADFTSEDLDATIVLDGGVDLTSVVFAITGFLWFVWNGEALRLVVFGVIFGVTFVELIFVFGIGVLLVFVGGVVAVIFVAGVVAGIVLVVFVAGVVLVDFVDGVVVGAVLVVTVGGFVPLEFDNFVTGKLLFVATFLILFTLVLLF